MKTDELIDPAAHGKVEVIYRGVREKRRVVRVNHNGSHFPEIVPATRANERVERTVSGQLIIVELQAPGGY